MSEDNEQLEYLTNELRPFRNYTLSDSLKDAIYDAESEIKASLVRVVDRKGYDSSEPVWPEDTSYRSKGHDAYELHIVVRTPEYSTADPLGELIDDSAKGLRAHAARELLDKQEKLKQELKEVEDSLKKFES